MPKTALSVAESNRLARASGLFAPPLWWPLVTVFLFILSAPLQSFAATAETPISLTNSTPVPSDGLGPQAMALDPISNTLYVTVDGTHTDNFNGTPENLVDVIDATTGTISTVIDLGPANTEPCAIAINPITNKIYVVACNAESVSVIDGSTNTLETTLPIGTPLSTLYGNSLYNSVCPDSIAVNSVTDKIYVGNFCLNDITIIDGATDTISATINLAPPGYIYGPKAIVINPSTNKIYVATTINYQNVTCPTTSTSPAPPPGLLAEIDGATNNVSFFQIPSTYCQYQQGGVPVLAINVVTNTLFMAINSSYLIEVNGTTGAVTSLSPPPTLDSTAQATSIAINPLTDHAYVGYVDSRVSTTNESANVIVDIDAPTGTTSLIGTGLFPVSVAVDPSLEQLYTVNAFDSDGAPDGSNALGNGTVSLINSLTNATTTVTAPAVFRGFGALITVDPLTQNAYVLNPGEPNPDTVYESTDVTTAGFVTPIALATNAGTTVSTPSDPFDVAVDPTTNLAYVADDGSNDVSVIDGSTDAVSTISTGQNPSAVAVDPIAHIAWVANQGSNTVTAINEATQATTTIPVGAAPIAVAVDPSTNMAYVANSTGNSVTEIDEQTDQAASIKVGASPAAIAIDQSTNRIYVADQGDNSLSIIDGATQIVTSVPVGNSPGAIAIDPNTNTIYVANQGSDTVSVLDGATGSIHTVSVGSAPVALALDSLNSRLYVVNNQSNDVSVINTGNNSVIETVATGLLPFAASVNATTNVIYIADSGSNTVTEINASDHDSTEEIPAGSGPISVAVNRVTGSVYVANLGDTTTVLKNQLNEQSTPLKTTIEPLPGNSTTNSTPTYTLTTTSSFAPSAPPVIGAFYQIDSVNGPWHLASGAAPQFAAKVGPLSVGLHILYATALDTQAALDVSPFAYGSADTFAASVAAYMFEVNPIKTTTTITATQSASQTNSVSLTASVSAASSSAGTPTGQVYFFNGSVLLGHASLNSNGQAVYSATGLSVGNHSFKAVYDGAGTFAASTSPVVTKAINEDFTVSATPASLNVSAGQSTSTTLTVTPVNGPAPAAISFTCNGLPTNGTCTFSPASITPGSTSATTKLTIQIANAASGVVVAAPPTFPPTNMFLLAVTLMLLACIITPSILPPRPSRPITIARLVLMSSFFAFVTACGGSGTAATHGTASTQYTVVVHAVNGSTNKTADITLNVN